MQLAPGRRLGAVQPALLPRQGGPICPWGPAAWGRCGTAGTGTRGQRRDKCSPPLATNMQCWIIPASQVYCSEDPLLCPHFYSILILCIQNWPNPMKLNCNIPRGPGDAFRRGQDLPSPATGPQRTRRAALDGQAKGRGVVLM